MIPRLETERLILREWRAPDFEPLAQMLTDPDVMRYLGGPARSRGDAWRTFSRAVGHWVLRGYGTWAVERKSDGALIGRIGLINPEGWPGLEVGWTLGRPYWGQGYATEAARASMNYGFLTQPVDRLISLIDPENKPSQEVAARLGETRGACCELTIEGHTSLADMWSITREEWKKSRA
jgi:RimJ/RimL family protein N-acetyltransferase